MSSAVVPSRANRRSSHSSAGVTAGSCSRSLWTSWTAKAGENGRAAPASGAPRAGSGLGDAARAEQRVGDRVRLVPRDAPRGDALGQAPEILDEDDSQRDRQRPQLADRQRLDPLIGADEPAEGLELDPAVGVRDERPGQPVHARDSPRAVRRRAWAAPDRTPAGGPPGSPEPAPRRCGSCSAATRPRARSCGSGGSPPRSPGATEEDPRVLAQPRKQPPPAPLPGMDGLFGRERPRRTVPGAPPRRALPESGRRASHHPLLTTDKKKPSRRAGSANGRRDTGQVRPSGAT